MEVSGFIWLVVSNIFYVHPYLGKIPMLTNIFRMGWNHQLVIPWIAAMFSRLSFLSLLERPSTLRSASPSRVLPETPGVTPSPSLRDLEVGFFYDGNRNGIMKWDPFWGGNQIKQCEAKIYGDFEGFHLWMNPDPWNWYFSLHKDHKT